MSIKNIFSFLFHLVTWLFGQVRKITTFPTILRKLKILLYWNIDIHYSIILNAKSSKLLQRQNFHFLVFKIQKQFCLKTKPLSLPSALHFMQRILEYSSREEDLTKGQSKNIICLHFLQRRKTLRKTACHKQSLQITTFYCTYTRRKNNLWMPYFMMILKYCKSFTDYQAYLSNH